MVENTPAIHSRRAPKRKKRRRNRLTKAGHPFISHSKDLKFSHQPEDVKKTQLLNRLPRAQKNLIRVRITYFEGSPREAKRIPRGYEKVPGDDV